MRWDFATACGCHALIAYARALRPWTTMLPKDPVLGNTGERWPRIDIDVEQDRKLLALGDCECDR